MFMFNPFMPRRRLSILWTGPFLKGVTGYILLASFIKLYVFNGNSVDLD